MHVFFRLANFSPQASLSKCKPVRVLSTNSAQSSKKINFEKNTYTETVSTCQMLAKNFVQTRFVGDFFAHAQGLCHLFTVLWPYGNYVRLGINFLV